MTKSALAVLLVAGTISIAGCAVVHTSAEHAPLYDSHSHGHDDDHDDEDDADLGDVLIDAIFWAITGDDHRDDCCCKKCCRKRR